MWYGQWISLNFKLIASSKIEKDEHNRKKKKKRPRRSHTHMRKVSMGQKEIDHDGEREEKRMKEEKTCRTKKLNEKKKLFLSIQILNCCDERERQAFRSPSRQFHISNAFLCVACILFFSLSFIICSLARFFFVSLRSIPPNAIRDSLCFHILACCVHALPFFGWQQAIGCRCAIRKYICDVKFQFSSDWTNKQ